MANKIHYGFSQDGSGMGGTCLWQKATSEPQTGRVSSEPREVTCIRCLQTFPTEALGDYGISLHFNGKRWVLEVAEPELDWSDLNDTDSDINIITGEVEI